MTWPACCAVVALIFVAAAVARQARIESRRRTYGVPADVHHRAKENHH